MTEGRLLRLLADRHSGDVFVPHCKNGPTNTIGSKVLILDGWALLSTWSPLTSVGYEVKCSRSDWLKDNKWTNYLPLCHLFYLVAPVGVIDASELPDGVGLLQPIGQGTGMRLVMKRKAVRREVQMPVQLMAYALMWRSTPERTRAQRVEEWAKAVESGEVGRRVAQWIRDEMARLRSLANAAEERMRTYDAVRQSLTTLGLDPDRVSSWSVDRQIEDAHLRSRLARLVADADALTRQMRTLIEA